MYHYISGATIPEGCQHYNFFLILMGKSCKACKAGLYVKEICFLLFVYTLFSLKLSAKNQIVWRPRRLRRHVSGPLA